MIRNCLTVCSDDDLKKINKAVFQILERTGMKVSEVLFNHLEEIGAKIDRAAGIAKFPSKVIEETLELVKKQKPGVGSSLYFIVNKDVLKEDVALPDKFYVEYGHLPFYYYDYDATERRVATEEEVVDMICLGDALEEAPHVNLPMLPPEEGRKFTGARQAALLALNTTKPGFGGAVWPEEVKYVVEIGDIIRGSHEEFLKRPCFQETCLCMISPLTFGDPEAKMMCELIKHGLPCTVATMPLSGANAPVTMAGNIALAGAEILGGMTAVRAVDRDTKLFATVISGIMDMGTTKSCFASPDAVLQSIGVHQLFKRLHGIAVNVDAAYTDAKVPGMQAACEKLFTIMAHGSTSTLLLPVGTLDGGCAFSPLQAMIDLELNRMIWKFFKGIKVDTETIALEEIERIGPAGGKTYLESEHTLRNFREALWFPELFDRTIWKNGKVEAEKTNSLMERANQKWKNILKDHPPAVIDKDKVKAVEEVVKKAEKELT